MSHKDNVGDILAAMLAGAPEAPKPVAVEDVAPEAGPEPAPEAGVVEAPEPVKKAAAKRRPPPKKSPEAGAEKSRSGKSQVAVLIDRDLVELMRLARPAFGGVKLAKIVLDAAREHWHRAADLPDSPLLRAVVNDRYGDTEDLVARYPIVTTPYLSTASRDALDADAEAAGLDRSAFVGRVLRAYLTVDVVFVPTEFLPMLLDPAEMRRIAEQLQSATRPARSLPEAARRTWAPFPVPQGHPLRQALDAARASMPGCSSATQALLTILPRLDGE